MSNRTPARAPDSAAVAHTVPAGTELELKLRLDPAAAAQVRRSRAVRTLKRGRALTRHLHSVYFDTPDQALRRGGLAVRVRHIGTRRIQTVKTAPLPGLGLMARREWESDIDADRPDALAIADPDLRQVLVGLLQGRAVQPIFEYDIRRTTWILHSAADAVIELALDVGTVSAGTQRQAICEVELELKSGPLAAVFELASDLNRTLEFSFENRSKADRGYALACAERPMPVKAKAMRLDRGMSAQQAFVAIAAACLDQIEANEAAACAGDNAEGVHQLRVACRRLRSAFTLFRPVLPPGHAALAAELKWFTGETGPARDWDVFLADTLAPLQAATMAEEPALAALRGAGQHCRAAGYDRLRAAIATPRFTRAKLNLRRWLADPDWHRSVDADAARLLFAPVTDLADLLLARRAKKFIRLGRRHSELSLPDLHELRIRGKRLRYATEFFATLYPHRKAKVYSKALTELQDVLGVLNDAAVAQALVHQAAGAEGGAADGWHARVEGIITGWHTAQSGLRLGRLDDAWSRFAACKPFWHRHGIDRYGDVLSRTVPKPVAALPPPKGAKPRDD